MPLCPACDAPLGDGARACLACGTPARFSFNKAKGAAAQATRALEGARKEIGLVRATGVDAPTAQRLLDKADAANRERHPGPALAYAQAARRAVTIAKTRARLQADLSKAQEAVQATKQGGADTTAAEKALDEAAKRVAAGEIRAADTWLRKASVRAQEERRAKSQQSLLKSAEKAIKYAKERGADVTAAQEALAKAREALRAKAFDAARDAAAKAKEAADNARKFSRYAKIVDGADHTIELARKSGADLADARHLLAEARKALKANLFAEAQAKAKATKEAVAEAKRYRAAELLVERAEKATIREERRGTDMASPAGILGEARTALEAREYRRVRDSVRDARDAIRDAIITRRLQGTLGQLTTDIAELKTIGADPMEAETFLAEATAALEARDFEKCGRLAARCRRAADDARDARRQEIVIDTVQNIVHAAAGSGAVDPAQIRTLIEDVESMLASGQAVDVDSLVKARLTLGDATRLKDLTKRLGNVRFGLLELRRGDIDVANSDEIIANAIGALDAGRYDEAEPPIAELEELTGQLMESLRATAADTIAKAKAAVQRAQAANLEVPDAARVLGSAEQALADGKVYEALEFGRIAQVRADSAWRKHFEEESKRDVEAMRSVADRVRRARERIDLLAANLEYLAGIGVDVATARDFMNNARQALDAKRIEETESHLEATERIVEGLRSELRQKAEEALARLKRNVLEARAQSLMTPEMEAVLLRADEAVRAEHYHEAIEAIRALDETIEHAKEERAAEVQRKEMERAKKASERFVRVRRMIEELRRANIDIQGADEALLAAEKALQTRDFERVDALLLDLEETAREMRAELVAAARFILSKARESVEAAEQAGIDVADARVLIQNAQGFLEKGKLDDAVEAANTAKQRADTALRLKSEEEARAERMRLETARQKIDRLRVTLDDLHRADIGVEGADEALTQAEQALAEKRYQDVHNVLADTEAIAETLREGLRVAAADLIEKSRQNVEVAKKTGLDIRRADMVLANAADAIREGRYVEAIEYHKVIDDIVEDSKRLRRFGELEAEVHVLRAELLRAASLGGDTEATEDLLKRAQDEVALGRYDRVAEYTQQVRLS
ncbi:MAG: hypothetical protein HY557_03305, partial [Euryarchaeota archaeon]|nr:hypothetical protein [Euryarchaeota archaeon]